ncbi:YihY/virulence factor BrkB family protein [Pigmentiphaga litoralis]|uniref:YihY/virulence factor BrkB family protein n=1 Tax=Pigmentiphaga litoralis TaxID=516702 RepID=UPI003B43C879
MIKRFFVLAKKSVNAWVDDYAPSMGAAISYYTVFSMAPLLIIVLSVAGFIWGREAVEGQLYGQLTSMIGQEGASGVQSLIASADKPAAGIVATIVSVAVLIFGATTVFAELQSALDRIWQVPEEQKQSGILSTIRARLLSFGLVLCLAFLLMVSLVISAGLAAVGSYATDLFPGWEVLMRMLNIAVSLAITTVLFALIFKMMPQAKIAWRDVWVGAFVTALLFEVGKLLIGLYIGKSSVTSSFAAAGSLVVVLLWVYYAAQVFLLGAEFTWVYANEHGSRANEGVDTDTGKQSSLPPSKSDDGAGSGNAQPAAIPAVQPLMPRLASRKPMPYRRSPT